MKTSIQITLAAMLLAGSVAAQDKIKDGTIPSGNAPAAGALLDLESNNRALLLPRVSLSATTTWGLNGTASPTGGYTVYNTNASITATTAYPIITGGIGVYYWDGAGWVATKNQSSSGSYVEPWFNQANNQAATTNTQNIYQMANVAVGKDASYGNATLDAEGAIRAGREQKGNVGRNSIGVGFNVTASAENSAAFGDSTVASGLRSVAFGNRNTASGINAFAAGGKNVASGINSSAFGSETSATGDRSTAFGNATQAKGDNSLAMGYQTEARGTRGIAIGYGSITGLNATDAQAFGAGTKATGDNSTAFGKQSTASGDNATAFGFSTTASNFRSTAFGNETTASGPSSTAFGWLTEARDMSATAFGWKNVARAEKSTAFGGETLASGITSTAFGGNTTASGLRATAFGYNTTASGESSTAFGGGSLASGDWGTAFGYQSKAFGVTATAFGSGSIARGNRSLAFGNEALTGTDANDAISMGNSTNAYHPFSLVMGSNVSSTENYQFRARFSGGYQFLTSLSSAATAVGVKLGTGDNAWSTLSSKALKENFLPVDQKEILKKVEGLQLTSWNYIGQDKAKHRHYGPMAEDFYEAFGKDELGTIGVDDSINQADFDGINLIAIQALAKENAELKARIEKLENLIQSRK